MGGLTDEELDALEQQLNCKLPEDLRAAYRTANGMTGETGCQILWPHNESRDSILGMNAFFDGDEIFATRPRDVVFFGDDGIGGYLCFRKGTSEAGIWYVTDGDHLDETAGSVAEIWKRVDDLYDEADRYLDEKEWAADSGPGTAGNGEAP